MADSGALRTERYKRHKMGDHSLCRSRRDCARPNLALAGPADDVGLDPAVELRRLAVRLAAAHCQDPANAALARELRNTLLALPSSRPEDPDVLDLLAALEAEGRGYQRGP